MTKSLKAQQSPLSDPRVQIQQIESAPVPDFQEKIQQVGLFPLTSSGIEIFQMNLGKICNQTCRHCHVDAAPDRKEIMSLETMEKCLLLIDELGVKTVDITGGAPEMNPYFRWLVEQLSNRGCKIMVRCNLTILLANPKFYDLPDFFKTHRVEVISSLPYFTAARTDAQRGEGVFEKSIRALRMLNEVGYGKEESNLILNLVYNPSGAFLPSSQKEIERQFKRKLQQEYGIVFNQLFCITNLPISRFLEYLLTSGNFETYMQKLAHAFNPLAAKKVMCRNTISVGWDGYLYDCDFNQMLDLALGEPQGMRWHLSNVGVDTLQKREIRVGKHCYGCTAGAGSSCGGAVV
ncbi:MAG: arsenosugar biosynthesis radical SAM protein ArsS [Flammeovirgaceae bacterium]|nr:arsenosugar biosynthesis radical SAM protein ArsS [Flammeovirgaceae bacterium]MDW8287057.1 arsenosugar biosynthesis radical SAM protein ArsS [Flammeovirgaceae bacterium]